jgi:hypothetical protein
MNKIKFLHILLYMGVFVFLACYTKPHIDTANIDLRDTYPISGKWAGGSGESYSRHSQVSQNFETKLAINDDGTYRLELANKIISGKFKAKYDLVVFYKENYQTAYGQYQFTVQDHEMHLERVKDRGYPDESGLDVFEGNWYWYPWQ